MKIKKVIVLILIFLMILNIFQNSVSAINMNEAYIENLGQCEMHLQYWKESENIWSYIITTMVGYRINGNLHYAYCMQQDRKGVGIDQESYSVKITEMLKDEKVWRAIINGFPYKTPEELGVSNIQDAFVATKQAIYCVIYNWNVDTRYRGADEQGWQIVNAIKNIVNSARNGTQTPNNSNVISINKLGDFEKDSNDFYSQEFIVSSTVDMSNYIVSNLENFPEGSYSSDMNNNPKTQFSSGEHFKILIPSKNILNNFIGKIKVSGKVKTYPIFYGASYDSIHQDYALTYDSFDTVNIETTMEVNSNKSAIKLIKRDSESNVPIKDVEFNFKYSDGSNIGNYFTDENGIIYIEYLKPGKIIVTELNTQSEYILDETPLEITLNYDEVKQIEFSNKLKKGNLKIIKVDKDNNNIFLSGVEFDLIDCNGNVISSIITDKNGCAEVHDLNIGNYILREKSTNTDYKLSLDRDITIEWGKTVELKLENEKIKGQIKIIKISEDDNPTTGDKANSPLENVEFEVYDVNGKIVDTLTTDEDGTALTKLLPKGKYIIKEKKSADGYLLDDNPYSVEIKNDGEIVEITLFNKSIPYIELPKLPVTGY